MTDETPKKKTPRKRASSAASKKPAATPVIVDQVVEVLEPDEIMELEETVPAPVEAPARRGLYLTPRQAFTGLAAVLLIALVALLVFLYFLLQPKGLGQRGGKAVEGIQPVLTIEGPGSGAQPTFNRPLGVAYGADDRIYVADTGNNRVCVFDSKGGYIRQWGGFGVAKPAPGGVYSWKPGRLNFPAAVATDERGLVYVADFRNDCIEVFDPDGKWLRRFPDPTKPVGKGSSGQDGRGIAVTAVAAKGGKVYATDTYQVFVFSSDGQLLRQFGKPGRGNADLDHPNGIAVGDDGTIYVSDSNHARVTAFSPDGKPKWNAGRVPASMNDTSPSAFELPRGVAVMPNKDVIVVDVFAFDLVRLSPQGKVLTQYGTRGVEPGAFNFPNAVSVVGNTLAVADKENNRVQVLRLVKH